MAHAAIMDAFDPQAIAQAAAVIRGGGLVAFPTETVYGLGADAANPVAVARIFEAKRRPYLDPLIVHVAAPEEARLYGNFPEGVAEELMRKFWPGPLTLVVPRTWRVPPIVTAGLDTVAIRMPRHPAALALIAAAGCALAAPSANLFGFMSPTTARHVADQLSERVDLILDGGSSSVGIESTILALTDIRPVILRFGGTTPEALHEVAGEVAWAAAAGDRPQAPGQLPSHYATRTPLQVLEAAAPGAEPRSGERVGLLAYMDPGAPEGYAAIEVLSPSGDLRIAAANLFGALHRLDRLQLDRLVAYPVPEQGLGIAIMDRLRRCAAGRERSGTRS